MKYSVLMSVYHKEKPKNLIESLESLINQTLKPDEIVLVKDGPLNDSLNKVIDQFMNRYDNLHVYELERNYGLGVALNYGLSYCKNEIVVRMDSDDISLPNRVEKQIEFLQLNPDVSVVGSYVEEFFDEDKVQKFIKKVPLEDNKIKETLKFKNAMNHPSVVFKKEDVRSVDGYIELKLSEDYFLWVRMAKQGYKFANIDEPLVKMRVSNDTYMRRGGYKYFRIQNQVYRYMRDTGFISQLEYLKGLLIRLVFRVILPAYLRKQVYIRLLRKG